MDLIVWGFTSKWSDWERDGFAGRTAVLTRALASDGRVGTVLVVEPPSGPGARMRADAARREPRLEQVDRHVHVLRHSRPLPRERHEPLTFALNNLVADAALVRGVNEAAVRLGMHAPVLWLAGPLGIHLAGSFGERAVVYDAVDDWAEHPAFRRMRGTILRSYERIAQRADVVFAVSPELASRFQGGRAAVVLAPNAVDPARFRAARAVPSDVACLPRPLAGYVGAMHHRFDHSLLADLAGRMPDVTFALVGRDAPGQERCGRENVHRLGFRPAHEVPAYVRAFDVCVVPHVDTALSRGMDPMKLYEFLAAGKPVVASRIPAHRRFEGLVRLAGGPDEFVDALRDVLAGRWRPDREAVALFVAVNSWQARAAEMLTTLETKTAG